MNDRFSLLGMYALCITFLVTFVVYRLIQKLYNLILSELILITLVSDMFHFYKELAQYILEET